MIECGGICCYVIKGDDGDILIDTGLEKYRDHIETWLLNYDITLIILTCGKAECVQNASYFSKIYNAPIMMSPYDVPLARDNSSRKYYITNPMGKIFQKQIELNSHIRMNPVRVDIVAEEGTDLSPYGIDGVIINLEGHTKGSIGVKHRSSTGYDIYCGSAVTSKTLPVEAMPLTSESPSRARTSINKIIAMNPDRILCTIGNPICKGSATYTLFTEMQK